MSAKRPAARAIEALPTAVTIFAGETERGPIGPTSITSGIQFQRLFGGYFRNDGAAATARCQHGSGGGCGLFHHLGHRNCLGFHARLRLQQQPCRLVPAIRERATLRRPYTST